MRQKLGEFNLWLSSINAVCQTLNWPKGIVFDEGSWSDAGYCIKNVVIQLNPKESDAFSVANINTRMSLH
jgi:hypothetical protein